MLELDECNQILVINPFADDSSTVSSSNNHDTDILVSLTLNSSSEHHPLRSQSVSPVHRYNTPSIPYVTVTGNEGETGPRLTGLLSSDGLPAAVVAAEDQTTNSEASRDSSDTIMHPVGPNDSFAGVALRYGVSIAALRRANQLWPSDPIHLRTVLLIPRGNTLRARRRPTRSANIDTALQSAVEPTPSSSPDLVTSTFIAARNMIVSVLPARISTESLGSKASASEDHELDDFRLVRAHKISSAEAAFAEEGHELSTLAIPHAQFKRPGVPLSSQVPCSPTNKRLDDSHIPPVGTLHSQCVSSSPIAPVERLSRVQPFAVLPVRTSQLEPEPAMELPVRRPRM